MCCARDISMERRCPLPHKSRSALAERPMIPLARRTLLVASLIAVATTNSLAQSTVRDYRRAHEREIIAEFTRLLAIPNVASDRENIRRNSQFILEMMQQRGLNPQLLEAKSKDTPPAVYGEW